MSDIKIFESKNSTLQVQLDHISNLFKEGELVRSLVVAKNATTKDFLAVQNRQVKQHIKHYNLDAIVSLKNRAIESTHEPI